MGPSNESNFEFKHALSFLCCGNSLLKTCFASDLQRGLPDPGQCRNCDRAVQRRQDDLQDDGIRFDNRVAKRKVDPDRQEVDHVARVGPGCRKKNWLCDD